MTHVVSRKERQRADSRSLGAEGLQSSLLLPDAPRIEDFEVRRLLGLGGRSVVWQVRRLAAETPHVLWVGDDAPWQLALKMPLSAPRCAPSLRTAYEELSAMLPLLHEHIVRPWGIVDHPQGPGLLLESWQAGSLAQLLRSAGPLSIGEVVTVVTPIAQAAAYVHSRGAAHGDITPSNILLNPEGRPALADLGDAAVLGMDMRDSSAAGDVAALGAVAWECLTGFTPRATAHRAPLAAVRPDVPAGLGAVLEEALNPSAAGFSAADFAAELFAVCRAEPVNLMPYVDDEALVEMPTRLPQRAKPGPRWWTGLRRLLRLRRL